jgi:hypothetical protein
LVWACLTLTQAWIARGKPMGETLLASYESWSRIMGGILCVAGVDGFLQDRDEIKAATGDADAPLQAFVGAWWARFGDHQVKIGSLDHQSAPPLSPHDACDLVSLLHHYQDEIDLGFNGHKRASWQSALGKVINRIKERVFDLDGLVVKVIHRTTNRGARVQLQVVELPSTAAASSLT